MSHRLPDDADTSDTADGENYWQPIFARKQPRRRWWRRDRVQYAGYWNWNWLLDNARRKWDEDNPEYAAMLKQGMSHNEIYAELAKLPPTPPPYKTLTAALVAFANRGEVKE